ncbi:MAG: helix-turn-helix transcriptional regulator [Chthonomonadales bacterium]|nr:helix-turn-helix transcriptional regulator [Chthonomonadales bacterium]
MGSAEGCQDDHIDRDRVARIGAAMAGPETARRLADVFSAFADPGRLRLLEALGHDELCVCELTLLSGLSQSSVSHHLRLLRNLRLVRHRRAGRLVYYSLDDEHVRHLVSQGLAHVREEEDR